MLEYLIWFIWIQSAILFLINTFMFLQGKRYSNRDFDNKIKPELSDSSHDNERPSAVLIIPCKGLDINLVENIASFSEQNYRDYRVLTIVETGEDPARPVLCKMAEKYSHLDIIKAGQSKQSKQNSQKNHNLLAGVAACDPERKIFVFTDSDHQPDTDWLRRIVAPLRGDVADIVTGYRKIRTQSSAIRWATSRKETY